MHVITVIAYTSFEEAATTGGTSVLMYHDLLGSNSDHYLSSIDGANPVNYVACSAAVDARGMLNPDGAELGFKTFYQDTGDGGVAHGAKIGVIGDVLTTQRGDLNQGGVAPHGRQYYALEDTSGFIYVEMDSVSTVDFTSLSMSAWVYIEAATWEDTDRVKMWAQGASGTETILLEGTELDSALTGMTVGNVTENAWAEYSSLPPDDSSVVMRFGLQASDSTEEVWVDYFRVLGSGPDLASQFCAPGGCAPGSFKGAGARTCGLCGRGTYSADGTCCLPCEPGTYSDRPGGAGCTQCPEMIRGGDSTSPPGATSMSQCRSNPRTIGYTSFEEVRFLIAFD